MNLKEVVNPKDISEFLHLPLKLYKNDPTFIRPLDNDIEKVFDRSKNSYLKNAKYKRWILLNETGETIGRIAAFYHKQLEKGIGGLGFFECIKDRKAAFFLFDSAKKWLAENGLEAMDGPINLGSRDRWWGLLVEGFYEPCYGSNYNPPYYQDFFEAYGFQLYYKQYTYLKKLDEKLRPALYSIAQRFDANTDYSFSHLKKNNLNKFINDFLTVYNKAWINHEGVGEMTLDQARNIVYSLKPVIDEQLVWFAYYKGEPVGFFISIPELNQLFVKYLKGEFTLLGKIRLMWNKWTGNCKTMYGIVFGIVPEHQKKGVEVALIVAASKVVQDKRRVPYRDLQMNWIGDFNPKMMKVAEQIGGKIYKTHYTYRYLFDRNKEFKRHPII